MSLVDTNTKSQHESWWRRYRNVEMTLCCRPWRGKVGKVERIHKSKEFWKTIWTTSTASSHTERVVEWSAYLGSGRKFICILTEFEQFCSKDQGKIRPEALLWLKSIQSTPLTQRCKYFYVRPVGIQVMIRELFFPNSVRPISLFLKLSSLFPLHSVRMESKLLVFWAGMPNGWLCGRCAVLRRFVLQQPPEARQPQQQQQEQQHREPEGRSTLFSWLQRDRDGNNGSDDDKSTCSTFTQSYRPLLNMTVSLAVLSALSK